jgi:hypothetical protein
MALIFLTMHVILVRSRFVRFLQALGSRDDCDSSQARESERSRLPSAWRNTLSSVRRGRGERERLYPSQSAVGGFDGKSEKGRVSSFSVHDVEDGPPSAVTIDQDK